MLSGEKILVTGPAGKIAFGVARSLAADNEVWGIARFGDPAAQAEVEALGVTTRRVDLYDADFSELPDDFTYVVHIAVGFEQDYDRAFRINGEGTGLLLQHCRNAKAALVMSSCSVYAPEADPYYSYTETDVLGDPLTHYYRTYPVSKIAEEVVARYCARAFDLPVVVARMNVAYGLRGGLPAYHMDSIVKGEPVVARWDPCAYSPIFDTDIEDQLEALLGAASVPATVVNWAGDEIVTVQEWATYAGELLGLPVTQETQPIPGGPGGMVADNTKRLAITGPCRTHWKDGFRAMFEARFPEIAATQAAGAGEPDAG